MASVDGVFSSGESRGLLWPGASALDPQGMALSLDFDTYCIWGKKKQKQKQKHPPVSWEIIYLPCLPHRLHEGQDCYEESSL